MKHPKHPAQIARRAWGGLVLEVFGRPPSSKMQELRDADCVLEEAIEALIDRVDVLHEEVMGLPKERRRSRPVVVTLCGSTRFREAYEEAQLQETLSGRIVLTVGGYLHRDERTRQIMDENNNKARVDELHFRKIDLSDEILVLNIDGYIGDSTRREIAYARTQGKRIRFLFDDPSLPEVTFVRS